MSTKDQGKSYRQRSIERKRKKYMNTLPVVVGVCIVLLVVAILVVNSVTKKHDTKTEVAKATVTPEVTMEPTPEPTPTPPAFQNASVVDKFSKGINCQYGILIDAETDEIVAQRKGQKQIYPASMTKIMTILVASEYVTEEQMEDTVKITRDITDYSFSNDCSIANFQLNEKVPVKDLFYGTILPSGADAAVALAKYVAGSHEEFVKLMNKKAEELGIGETTHFTNCVGIYNKKHYSTCYDMAVILKVASENELCSQVMNTRIYNTTVTKKHKKGMRLSNLFLRRIEDRFKTGDILYAKTGFVNQSGNCCVSMAAGESGHRYICVTAGSQGAWQCIKDQMNLYSKYGEGIKKVKGK